MSISFEIIHKADLVWRNNQPYSENFDDIYFSVDDGCLKKEHVFIHGNRLPQRWEQLQHQNKACFVIAETGFGTGLNFLITWYFWPQFAPPTATLYYYSCEKLPLSLQDLKRSLAAWPQLDSLAAQLMANYPILTPGFHPRSFQNGRVNLILMLGDVSQCYTQLLVSGDKTLERDLRDFSVDAWFLDGFAPVKNETMWPDEFFEIMGLLSTKGTTASTCSAARLLKERLTKHGFVVGRAAEFAKKTHGLTAEFKAVVDVHHGRYCAYRSTPWHVAPRRQLSVEKRATVLGGGLAGCFTAYSLAKRGWKVTVLEEKNQVGLGASGNHGAVLYPQFSAFRSPLTELMLMAFLYAVRFYRPLLDRGIEGELNGILQFASNQRELTSQRHLRSWLEAYPELGRLVGKTEASDLAGLSLQEGGLFIPDSGWINSPSMCEYLINHPLITVKTNTAALQLIHHHGLWDVGGDQAEIVVIANGYCANQFKETDWLPIKQVAGQMTYIKANQQSDLLKIPLCGNAHLLPAKQNRHALGATFHQYLGDPSELRDDVCKNSDDQLNVARLQQLPIDWDFPPEAVASWGGVRAATPDYLPLVGPVAIPDSFRRHYGALVKDSRRFIPTLADHYPGLYLCTGFGSRGLTSIPLCCEWLASHLNQEPGLIPKTLLQAISPSRFLRQDIIKKV